MNLKQEARQSNAFYATDLAIGTLTVPLLLARELLCVDGVTGVGEVEVEEQETSGHFVCISITYGTLFVFLLSVVLC
jgi:hypothetical protein